MLMSHSIWSRMSTVRCSTVWVQTVPSVPIRTLSRSSANLLTIMHRVILFMTPRRLVRSLFLICVSARIGSRALTLLKKQILWHAITRASLKSTTCSEKRKKAEHSFLQAAMVWTRYGTLSRLKFSSRSSTRSLSFM